MARRRKKESFTEAIFMLIAVMSMGLVFSGAVTKQEVFNFFMVLVIGIIIIIAMVVWWRKRTQNHYSNPLSGRRIPPSSVQPAPFSEPVSKASADCPTGRPTEHPISNGREGRGQWSIGLLQRLEWRVFEKLVADYFTARGMQAQLTSNGADGGVDIIVTPATTNQQHTIYVQCKAWNQQAVGVKPVRELYGVMAADKASLGWC